MKMGRDMCLYDIDQVGYYTNDDKKVPVSSDFIPISGKQIGADIVTKAINGIGVSVLLCPQCVGEVIKKFVVISNAMEDTDESTVNDRNFPVLTIIGLTQTR